MVAWGRGRHLLYGRPAMSAAEPHPRRRRALRRALLTAVASGVLVVGGSGGPAVGQILPTSTTEPAPVTT